MSKTTLIVEISRDELALRMALALQRAKAPPGMSAIEALASMPEDMRDDFLRMAKAAAEYFMECVGKGVRPN